MEVEVAGTPATKRVIVRDNGIGMDPAAANERRGLGLLLVKNLARQADAKRGSFAMPAPGWKIFSVEPPQPFDGAGRDADAARPMVVSVGCANSFCLSRSSSLPVLGIVIPALNCAAALDRTLNSIGTPAEAAGWPVVVVDGGSIDDSVEVARRHGTRRSRRREGAGRSWRPALSRR